jgi:phosphogluconate dehydratase
MSNLHPAIDRVTDRIIDRSRSTRAAYLDLIERQRKTCVNRSTLSCGNLAHGFAAAEDDKPTIRSGERMNIGIVTAFNDMLSAHQPYYRYPEQIKVFAREVGATAQVAGGVPAMCDGVTQGQAGMELSLFSRDTIALSTAVALSHAMFEGALLLGICDKIVPGLLMGALRFGHLPTILVPGGPMRSGIPNKEKARIRQLYAEGKAGRDELLEAESASYHSAGTCTFYGTANSNQMMMEVMGLHVPNAAFANPGTKLRQELTRAAVHRIAEIGWAGNDYRPIGRVVDEKAVVNATVGLMATGGSTNHAIHLPAIARAAGIVIDWQDMEEISEAVPLLARVYPNGSGDVNDFREAGGLPFVIRELLDAGLLHGDILTISRNGMADYTREPTLPERAGEGRSPDRIDAVLRPSPEHIEWVEAPEVPRDPTMVRPVAEAFQPTGGMKLLKGNLGRAIMKTSAIDPRNWVIEAPARVFDDQDQVLAAFKAGELDRDAVVIVRFQGPAANGMPELHKLTPALGVLQDRGHHVALVTDGRMSGASGKVPAAIHLYPEALHGGPIARVADGDIVRVDALRGTIENLEPAALDRSAATAPNLHSGLGRELFRMFQNATDDAEQGASPLFAAMSERA